MRRDDTHATTGQPAGVVVAVASDEAHHFSKPVQQSIMLVAGLGIAGDAHAGVTVQHLSRIRRDPSQPNLRQVHLIASELIAELDRAGYPVTAGDLGENVTTAGIDLLALPAGARLRIGASALVEVTGLRNPCRQIDGFSDGLLKHVLTRDADGAIVRRAGIMGIVHAGGAVRAGDRIVVELPPGERRALDVV
ncbi:MAG TPA: MOSC domain-containing protein [Micromonosporaceae bacterium]|nr:MOSC domain-containing protein [Micromonosporaceae bacterium]